LGWIHKKDMLFVEQTTVHKTISLDLFGIFCYFTVAQEGAMIKDYLFILSVMTFLKNIKYQ
jgi:hypothetical protein